MRINDYICKAVVDFNCNTKTREKQILENIEYIWDKYL